MRGVTTHVSAPKSSTYWTTALKKSDTCDAVPSLLRILVSLRHADRALARFMTTAGHSLSVAEITRPKYLKDFAISRGIPYVMKALDVTALSSSFIRRRLLRSAPFSYCAVCQCIPFRSCHGTNMSHRGHRVRCLPLCIVLVQK